MKTYTVEIANMPADMINGKNPKDAVKNYLNKYNIKYKEIQVYKVGPSPMVAKVCLLGGTRESISYYNIIL